MNNKCDQRIEQAKSALRQAYFVIIAGGAGLSNAAGIKYSGQRFSDNFKKNSSKPDGT